MTERRRPVAKQSPDLEERRKRFNAVFSPITWPLGKILATIKFIFVSIMLGTLIDWLGMWLGWWGNNHQLEVLTKDIAYLGANFTVSIFGIPPADLAIRIGQTIQSYLGYDIKLNPADPRFFRMVKDVLIAVQPYWQSIIYSAMTVGVRVFIIAMSLFFYVVVFLVAMIDGLVERELRKLGGGIERAKLYHHAKIWIPRVLYFSPMIYLAWPNSINPSWIVLPSAIVFGIAVYMTFSTFMKYF